MMYWIVFALFSALESLLDPMGNIFLPFYTEIKIVILLYLSLPLTRGSGVVYRKWIHPLLCSKEQEIDRLLEHLQEQGVETAKAYITRGAQMMGGFIVSTAVRSGGNIVQSLKNSYSMTDLSQSLEWSKGRFTDLTEEHQSVQQWLDQSQSDPVMYSAQVSVLNKIKGVSRVSSPGMRRRQIPESGPVPRVLSSDSISSGYMTGQGASGDHYFPVDSDTMDTGDYELWERRSNQSSILGHGPGYQSNQMASEQQEKYQRREKKMNRQPYKERDGSEDEEDEKFYESYQTPSARSKQQNLPPASFMNRPVEIKTPDSIMSPYPASDYSDWETETENDKTPTRAEAKNLTLEELQAAAMKLNLCIVTNKESANSDLPVVPPRQNKNDLSSPIFTDSKGNDPNLNSKAIKEEYNIKECLKEENTQEMHNEPAVDLKVDVFTSEEARKLETKESLFSAEENLVISRSVSCETVKTEDSGKPRSHKKVKAPLPPVAAIPYTAVTLSAAINPSTADVPSTTSTPSAEASTDVTAPISSYPVAPSLSEPNAITDALSLSSINNDKRGQIESGVDDVGKVLYRSKGYEDTEPSVGQSERQKKINIRDISLENQILDRESVSEAPLSKTFMRNQEFLQPLVQDREVNRLSGGYDSDENNPFREPETQKESYPAMSPRLFTYNPSTGIQRLRKYDAYEDYSSSYNRPTSPSVSERYRDMPTSPTIDRFSERSLSPSLSLSSSRPTSPLPSTSDYYDSSSSYSRCPHCTIHTWLPHSPACPNRRK